jgi:hypothetical protein
MSVVALRRRSSVPSLWPDPDGFGEINLDFAATTPALKAAVEAVQLALPWYGSLHRGGGRKSEVSTAAFDDAGHSRPPPSLLPSAGRTVFGRREESPRSGVAARYQLGRFFHAGAPTDVAERRGVQRLLRSEHHPGSDGVDVAGEVVDEVVLGQPREAEVVDREVGECRSRLPASEKRADRLSLVESEGGDVDESRRVGGIGTE